MKGDRFFWDRRSPHRVGCGLPGLPGVGNHGGWRFGTLPGCVPIWAKLPPVPRFPVGIAAGSSPPCLSPWGGKSGLCPFLGLIPQGELEARPQLGVTLQ